MQTQRTTESLREMLFEAIERVSRGDMETKDAKVIGELACRIIESARLELEHASVLDKLDKSGQGITPGRIMLVAPFERDK